MQSVHLIKPETHKRLKRVNFLFGANEKLQNVPQFEMDFVLNFAMCSADFTCVNGSTIQIAFSELLLRINFLDFFGFSFLKISFPGFIVIQTGYWPDSKLESISIIKNIFVMKNVTDFRKTVETVVDPRLIFCHRLARSTSKLCFVPRFWVLLGLKTHQEK